MLNNCVFMGRIAQDLELRKTTSNISVCAFTLAVQRSYKKEGEDYKTDWIDCIAFRNTADFISRCFRKGELIAIRGEMQTRTYTDKNGNKRKATELIIEKASFCGGKKSDTAEAADMQQGFQDVPEFTEINEDDLPF
ncbi:MAG: single-stranded DNA-binding protein [Clostridia bacterium]|nr:single-stranded DNA-binding protein [Clostridia bacterium]